MYIIGAELHYGVTKAFKIKSAKSKRHAVEIIHGVRKDLVSILFVKEVK